MTKQQVVSLKFHKVKPEQMPAEVKERGRSINRVFSRMTSTPSMLSDLPTQVSFGRSEKGRLGTTRRSINRAISKVFSLESEEGVVITSTRKLNPDDKVTKVFRLQSEEGVVITSTRKVDEPQDDFTASTISTSASLEHTMLQAQLENDALLLAAARKNVQSNVNKLTPRKSEGEARKNVCDTKDGEASIFNIISGAVGACSIRLCFERDEQPVNRKEVVIVSEAFVDDMSSLSGLSRFNRLGESER